MRFKSVVLFNAGRTRIYLDEKKAFHTLLHVMLFSGVLHLCACNKL